MGGVLPRVEEIVVGLVLGRFMAKPGWGRSGKDGVVPGEMTLAEGLLVGAVYVWERYWVGGVRSGGGLCGGLVGGREGGVVSTLG